MSGNPSSIFDGYFQGTVEESRARLPEQVVDDAIKAMSLDPEQDVENGHHGTLKEWVWDWLVSLIASYGGPGPTEIETTPKMLQKKAQADAKKLREAADVLRNLTYESLYSSNGTQSSAAISHSLRRASLPKEGPRAFHGQHAAKYHHERFGVWPVLLGSKARNHGSIISDIWEGTGAEFAEQDAVVVFPTGGWWKYRKFLQRYNEKVRYSLIVTLESEDAEIDIYSEIENIIATRVATTVATPV